MAGMLPGVECARRRRFHQSITLSDSSTLSSTTHNNGSTRRSSFCLYTSNHETHHSSTSSLMRKLNPLDQDEKLGQVAREAKERLDGRLRTQRKSKTRSECKHASRDSLIKEKGKTMVTQELQRGEFGSKESGSRKFIWSKLSWKDKEQEECAVCLEQLKVGENLVHLPCAHRFHSRCLVPWLENNAHCPCCRMGLIPHY